MPHSDENDSPEKDRNHIECSSIRVADSEFLTVKNEEITLVESAMCPPADLPAIVLVTSLNPRAKPSFEESKIVISDDEL